MTWNESLIKIPKQYAYNSIQKYTQSLLRGKKKKHFVFMIFAATYLPAY